VVELSLSLPDDLVEELRAVASDDVSAFVAAAVKHELDRQRLHVFVEELVTELGRLTKPRSPGITNCSPPLPWQRRAESIVMTAHEVGRPSH
jgi:hypothetical protein